MMERAGSGMDDRVVPSVWASVRYQDGMREDLRTLSAS